MSKASPLPPTNVVKAPFPKETLVGGLHALFAYSAWGLAPLYWKLIVSVPAPQLVSHRILWSLVALVPTLVFAGQWKAFLKSLGDRRRIILLTVTATLLSANWLAFIFAVQNRLIVQASLGYFITPLFNVVLGRIFLKERLRPIQQIAFALVCCGVLSLVVQAHQIPWTALFVAATFSSYGLLRKIAPVDALIGLSIENLVLSPVALGYLLYCNATHELALFKNLQTDLLIPLTGPITAVPLISFALAAKRLRLSTLGFFQYLAPTIQLLLAVFAYGEPFTGTHMIAFGLIWCALGIYLIDSVYAAKAAA